MQDFFITLCFLAFCITVIALTQRRADISTLAVKTLGKAFGKLSDIFAPSQQTKDKFPGSNLDNQADSLDTGAGEKLDKPIP